MPVSDEIFPLLSHEAIEYQSGAWGALLQEFSHFEGNVSGAIDQLRTTWHGGAGHERFFDWWWGQGERNGHSGRGAKGDTETFTKMIGVIIHALDGFDGEIDGINVHLRAANQIMADHQISSDLWEVPYLKPEAGGPGSPIGAKAVFRGAQGTMHPYTTTGATNWYIAFLAASEPFPYKEYAVNTGAVAGILRAPQWFVEANEAATLGVQAFNAACQDCIDKLHKIVHLSTDIRQLVPYDGPMEGVAPYHVGTGDPSNPWIGRAAPGMAPGAPDIDPTWEQLTGQKVNHLGTYKRPWPFSKSRVVGKVVDENGKTTVSSGGDPFNPPNVPSWYPKPSIGQDVSGFFAKYGIVISLAGLLLPGVGEVLDGVLDSSAFLAGLTDLADTASVPGLLLKSANGVYNIAVDSGQVQNVAKAVTEDLLGDQIGKLPKDVVTKVMTMVKDELIEKSTQGPGGERLIDVTNLKSSEVAQAAGYTSVAAPIVSNPTLFGT